MYYAGERTGKKNDRGRKWSGQKTRNAIFRRNVYRAAGHPVWLVSIPILRRPFAFYRGRCRLIFFFFFVQFQLSLPRNVIKPRRNSRTKKTPRRGKNKKKKKKLTNTTQIIFYYIVYTVWNIFIVSYICVIFFFF